MRFYTGIAVFGQEIEGIGGFPPDPSHPGGYRFAGRQVKASSVQTVYMMSYSSGWWRIDYYGTDATGAYVYGLCGAMSWNTGAQFRNAGVNMPRDDYFALESPQVFTWPWQGKLVWALVDRVAMGYAGYMYQVGSGFWMLRKRGDAKIPAIEGIITARESGGYCGVVDYELVFY